MASLLVTHRVYRLKIQSVMLLFSTGFVNHSPSMVSSPPLSPFPCVNKYTAQCTHLYSVYGVIGGKRASNRKTPAAKYLYWSIFKKSRHLGFFFFIYIWSKLSSLFQLPATNFESLHCARFHEVQN